MDRLQALINKCVHRILNIHWPDRISSKKNYGENWSGASDGPNTKTELA